MESEILKEAIKTAKWARVLAKLIDLFLVFIVSIALYPVGTLLACAFLLTTDSYFGGQSIGKKLIGFSVIMEESGLPCSLKASIIRNLPIAIPFFLSIIPFWGWVASIIIGTPVVAIELYLLLTLDSGKRLGDVIAGTTVVSIHYKEESSSSGNGQVVT